MSPQNSSYAMLDALDAMQCSKRHCSSFVMTSTWEMQHVMLVMSHASDIAYMESAKGFMDSTPSMVSNYSSPTDYSNQLGDEQAESRLAF